MKSPGQPRKYSEPLRSLTFKLPMSEINKIKAIACLNGTTVTQQFLNMLEQEYKLNKDLLDKILTAQQKSKK